MEDWPDSILPKMDNLWFAVFRTTSEMERPERVLISAKILPTITFIFCILLLFKITPNLYKFRNI